MAQSKKFGTFGGVFTPSLLTILGVIMYLRLPWIISQGGLFYTLVIIVVAHIVSITTGLSVSSIATDKKVEAGGNYYIISRSLGLPIGGTLGIALFIGLSFSISLYIIGFCESLLSVLEIPIEISSIRLYGSITLVLLTIVIFISTSLAIKVQYFILAAVVISLVSIFMGGIDLPQDQYVLNPSPDGVDLFVLFGIFFPAVTGFTAGVQMSGDLKDPKKSIPFGTIAAIGIGFFVYIGLAIFIAFKIETTQLANDPNVLVSIAWIPQLVIAGVWGATISSALGSILGAPRILQATSADNVTPRFFKKGYGVSNEPRRALLFTFLIAEAGILIGELNIIARIVSIFFISTYGLINLSYAIEVWASTDFRPSFKVPIWVGIVGALSSAIIMFELDVLAFVVATIVLSALYLFLKKKELTLESGDTWSSFWSSVVRSGLHRLNESVLHKRNWRPNILLFRGPANSRNHLLNFGKWLVGKSGIISDFELVETMRGGIKFTKAAQQVKSKEQFNNGIFKRRYECLDIYSGIAAVSQFYGFSGVDPNTVILGWPKKSSNPKKLLLLLKRLRSLDYNILLLDQDNEKAFGSFATIDLWWRGGSNNATLALVLMRFIQSANEWSSAKFRIFIIVDDSALINKVHRNMDHLMKDLRQNAEIKIINNAIEYRPFQEIMKVESASTDLTIVGLPSLTNIDGVQFVNNTNSFIQNLNSVLLINASSFFEPYFIGIERTVDEKTESELKQIQYDYAKIKLPADEILAKRLTKIFHGANDSIEETYATYFSKIEQELIEMGLNLKTIVEHNLKAIEKKRHNLKSLHSAKLLNSVQSDILNNGRRLLINFKKDGLGTLELNLRQGIQNSFILHKRILDECPETQALYYKPGDLSISYSDPFPIKFLKAKKLLSNRFFKTEIRIDAKLYSLVTYYVNGFLRSELFNQISQIGIVGYNVVSDLQKMFNRLFDVIKNLEVIIQNTDEISLEQIVKYQNEVASLFDEYENQVGMQFKSKLQQFLQINQKTFQELIAHFDHVNINQVIKKKYTLKKDSVEKTAFNEMPSKWVNNLAWMINFAGMELILEDFKNRLKTIIISWTKEIDTSVYRGIDGYFQKIQKRLTDHIDKKSVGISKFGSDPMEIIEASLKSVSKKVQKIVMDLPEFIDVISEQSFQSLETDQFEEQEIVSVYLRKLIGSLVEKEFLNNLNDKIDTFKEKLKSIFDKVDEIQDSLAPGFKKFKTKAKIVLHDEQNIDYLIKNARDTVVENKKEFEVSYQQLIQYSKELMQTSIDKMNSYLITNSTKN